MVGSLLVLGDILRSVPFCFYPTTWDELIILLCEQSSSEIVMVGTDFQPLGMISMNRLLVDLGERSPRISTTTKAAVFAEEFTEIDIERLLEPILSFQEDTLICEFLSQLIPDSYPHYGIVNREGQFLGLIDLSKLLHSLGFGHKKSMIHRIPPFLSQVLDQFPLPLRVESESNFILYQNLAWQGEVGGQYYQERALPWQERALPWDDAPSGVGELLSDAHYPLIAAQLSCAQWLEHRSHQAADLLENDFSEGIGEKRSQRAEKIWQFVKCPFQVSAGSQNGWLTVAIDLTHSHQISQELTAKNQDLIQLNRLKDEFFASISHEIKSPVTTIVGLSSLLREHPGMNLNPRQQEYVDLILRNGRQLMTLVNDLLDLTSLETGQMSLNCASILVRDICEQVLQMVENKYCDRFLGTSEIKLEISSEFLSLMADELRLKQILAYLLDNAVQSTAKGGKLGLKVRPSGGWLTFTVWDTGMGIAETSQPFVFERIHPSKQTWVPRGDGMGLGLVLAQKLAQAHGGDISFWSKEGQGSQFTLIIPSGSSDNALPSGEKKPLLGKENWVLIVDAIAKTLEELPPLLSDLGYSVMIARTGLEAVDKARRLQPQLIFLNPSLPLLSGWDVLTLLKSADETRHITVILTENPIERPPAQTFSEDLSLPPPYTLENLKIILQQPVEQIAPTSLANRSLTILSLFPESNCLEQLGTIPKFPFDLNAISQLSHYNHRILEAEDLDQAEMLTQVWDVDVMVLDGRRLSAVREYLIAFSQSPRLATLPLVILDLNTAEIANQVTGLTVFPCLLLEEKPSLDQFWQVLQVATRLQSQNSSS